MKLLLLPNFPGRASSVWYDSAAILAAFASILPASFSMVNSQNAARQDAGQHGHDACAPHS
jgi:hypothetical protein